jgi:hypothetical protein
MLKPAQHDKKNYVIPNLFRNLEFANDNELIAFVLVIGPLSTGSVMVGGGFIRKEAKT